MHWQPLKRTPTRLQIVCVDCGRSSLNESNRLKRDGWQESGGRPAQRRYRCGTCSQIAVGHVSDDIPDGPDH